MPESDCTSPQVGLLITFVEKVCLGANANPKGLGGWMWVAWAKMMFVPTHVGDPQVRLQGRRRPRAANSQDIAATKQRMQLCRDQRLDCCALMTPHITTCA